MEVLRKVKNPQIWITVLKRISVEHFRTANEEQRKKYTKLLRIKHRSRRRESSVVQGNGEVWSRWKPRRMFSWFRKPQPRYNRDHLNVTHTYMSTNKRHVYFTLDSKGVIFLPHLLPCTYVVVVKSYVCLFVIIIIVSKLLSFL